MGRKERRAGFLSWNRLETSYLGSEPFPSTGSGYAQGDSPPCPQPLPFPGAWLGGWERLVLTRQLYCKALLWDGHRWQPSVYVPVKDVKKENQTSLFTLTSISKGKGKSLKEEGDNFRVTGSQERPFGFLSRSAVLNQGPTGKDDESLWTGVRGQ